MRSAAPLTFDRRDTLEDGVRSGRIEVAIANGVDFGTLKVRVTLLDSSRDRLRTISKEHSLHQRLTRPRLCHAVPCGPKGCACRRNSSSSLRGRNRGQQCGSTPIGDYVSSFNTLVLDSAEFAESVMQRSPLNPNGYLGACIGRGFSSVWGPIGKTRKILEWPHAVRLRQPVPMAGGLGSWSGASF